MAHDPKQDPQHGQQKGQQQKGQQEHGNPQHGQEQRKQPGQEPGKTEQERKSGQGGR